MKNAMGDLLDLFLLQKHGVAHGVQSRTARISEKKQLKKILILVKNWRCNQPKKDVRIPT
jgi:hypothetical protein